jgi:hypothetical protein
MFRPRLTLDADQRESPRANRKTWQARDLAYLDVVVGKPSRSPLAGDAGDIDANAVGSSDLLSSSFASLDSRPLLRSRPFCP